MFYSTGTWLYSFIRVGRSELGMESSRQPPAPQWGLSGKLPHAQQCTQVPSNSETNSSLCTQLNKYSFIHLGR